MADAFLRRVVVRRELEQEESILATPLETFAPEHCRVCGRRLNAHDDLGAATTVCVACGGRRRQRQLERDDAELERATRMRCRLVAVAGFNPNGGAMEKTERPKCTKCGGTLRSANGPTECYACRKAEAKGSDRGGQPKASPASKELKKNFAVVARALGEDPDELINAFCEGWMESLKRSHARLTEDAAVESYAPSLGRADHA